MRSVLIASAAIISMASFACAQTAPGTPPAGTGTGAPTTGSHADLDLPIQPAHIGDSIVFGPGEEEGDDPRDKPPPVIYGEEIDTESDSLFYVIDQSCSMGWDVQVYTLPDGTQASGPRMERAKAELIRSILGLSDNFEFNIVAYDCGTRQWSPDMQEANDANKQSAAAWANALQPGGATGTAPATAQALGAKENLAVVLLTDGAPNCGANGSSGHRSVIRNSNTQGATINVFGIAATGSYRAFCQGVASDSGGSYFDVP